MTNHFFDDPDLMDLEIAVHLACLTNQEMSPSLEDDGAEITISRMSEAELFNEEVECAIDAATVMPQPATLKARIAKPSSVDDGWDEEDTDPMGQLLPSQQSQDWSGDTKLGFGPRKILGQDGDICIND